MTPEDRVFLERINAYADNVLHDIDPQKTKISYQLDKLKPIMEEIAVETNSSVADIFIKYMDKDKIIMEEFILMRPMNWIRRQTMHCKVLTAVNVWVTIKPV